MDLEQFKESFRGTIFNVTIYYLNCLIPCKLNCKLQFLKDHQPSDCLVYMDSDIKFNKELYPDARQQLNLYEQFEQMCFDYNVSAVTSTGAYNNGNTRKFNSGFIVYRPFVYSGTKVKHELCESEQETINKELRRLDIQYNRLTSTWNCRKDPRQNCSNAFFIHEHADPAGYSYSKDRKQYPRTGKKTQRHYKNALREEAGSIITIRNIEKHSESTGW
eukprot:CAMPEP_0201508444 /NCGR_PEP_ID=MMETSP0161_2-20130828/1818_1 /ASSEMBLY_ACC=CAM_ASM_000251 /TAXON_ID=180227 /ORGANISM="Neoparamoeba aestuarina, Strain SoJaBio B1-5/56/2" /LENGTH=217 /DNA_ID=CAMNT_0047903117 /DNA_START=334 /DNA_END=984 /DNA_ORIENTATION=-